MAIQYSIQKMVSDGTLSTIALGIQYLQRNDIYMRIAGEETPQVGAHSGYTWSFINNTTLKILPVVPNGVEVVVYRRTGVDAMYNVYSHNAQFDEATIDKNNQQLLYIAQEYLEQGLPGTGVDTIEYVRDDGSFTYYRMRRTDGSYSEEFTVPSASNSTKVLTRESLRRSYAEASYNLVDGSFEAGGTLVNANDVLLQERTGKAFSGPAGTVAAGTNPTVVAGYVPRTDVVLRSELTANSITIDELSKLNVIVSDITLNVPSSYATIASAISAIASKTIQNTAVVTIKVADGNYVWNSNQNLNHENGDRIEIIGNQTTPTNVTITTTSAPTFDMFSVTDGHKIRLLDGMYITTPTKTTSSNNFTAILADNGSSIKCGPKVKTNNWYYGIAARNGSFISCMYADVQNSGDVGIWAFNGSTVDARHATSNLASDAVNNWGWGFEAEYGSMLDCSGGSSSGCRRGGAGALSNSVVRALNFNGSSNIGSGLYAISGGVIEAHNATLNSNTKYGYEQETSGNIYGANITTAGNAIAPFSNYAYFDNSGVNGARLAANGPLRLDTNGADPVYFNTSGGLQFEVRHAPGASNHLYAQGAPAGSPVILGAEGADSVIDLQLNPKGAGSYLRLGTGYVVTSNATITGCVSIKDNTGTIRKLAVIS
jgi:hypothetical protein